MLLKSVVKYAEDIEFLGGDWQTNQTSIRFFLGLIKWGYLLATKLEMSALTYIFAKIII